MLLAEQRYTRTLGNLLRLVDDEGGHLHLLLGVEAHDPDVVVRVVLLAGRDLLEDLVTVGAPEHRELPHHPVPVVVEARAVRRLLLRERALGAVELEAGGEALAEHVADLLLDVLVGQGREVREGLELEGRLPHLSRSSIGRHEGKPRTRIKLVSTGNVATDNIAGSLHLFFAAESTLLNLGSEFVPACRRWRRARRRRRGHACCCALRGRPWGRARWT